LPPPLLLECPESDVDDEDEDEESEADAPDTELEDPADRLEMVFVKPPKEPPKECPIELMSTNSWR
jgi:hypothetical protein